MGVIFLKKSFTKPYIKGFIPYALASALVSIVGGFTTALGPAFVSALNLPYNNTTWTALSMAIGTATFAPILGKLGDIVGRRPTLFIGIFVFTLGNALSAIAPSLIFMIFARFVVGIGSAAIAPVVMSYIVTDFPPEKIAKGFSLYMLISSAAVIFGPTLGSLVIEFWGFRVMMWICVLICILIFFLCLVTSKKEHYERKKIPHFDALGSVWVVIFFSLCLALPTFAQNFGVTSRSFLIILIASLLSFLGLFLTEKRAENPILNAGFMRRKVFILSVLALFLTQGLLQANMTNIIVFVRYTEPFNTIISGYAISIMYIGMSLGSILIGPLSDKREPKAILIGSLSATGIGCALMLLFSQETSVLLLAASLGILGFGLGANASIFMKIVLSGLEERDAGSGTGTYGLFRDLAAPFGVAVFVPLFTNKITSMIEHGTEESLAALNSIHFLSVIELVCIIVAIFIVLFLPKIYRKKDQK